MVNAHIHCYGDNCVEATIEQLPEWMTVYVFDGRLSTFPQLNGSDVTPGLEAFCAERQNVRYCVPDDLPFGNEDESDFSDRMDIVEKAWFANYEVLPQDEWTLKIDVDERIINFRVNPDALDVSRRYFPKLYFFGPNQLIVPRLWVPQHWTFYMPDNSVPRHVVHRDEPLDVIRQRSHKYHQDFDRIMLNEFEILNDISSYSGPYLRARIKHLCLLGDARKARIYSNFMSLDFESILRDLSAEMKGPDLERFEEAVLSKAFEEDGRWPGR